MENCDKKFKSILKKCNLINSSYLELNFFISTQGMELKV